MNHYSLYKITRPYSPGFSLDDYSLFKYGHNQTAKKFGKELAHGFFSWYADNYLNTRTTPKQLVIICSPYSYIPPASQNLMTYFVRELNNCLFNNGLKPVQTTKAYRSVSYIQDYGALTKDERLKLISQEIIHLDTEFCKGKHLIFLDDVKITGSHEHVMVEMLKRSEVKEETSFIYFAELINKAVHPEYEDYINHFHVKTLPQLRAILNNGATLNMRMTKFILKSSQKDCEYFLQSVSQQFREQLWDYALGENYHKTPEYELNMETLYQLTFKPELV